MERREFCELIAAVGWASALSPVTHAAALAAFPPDSKASWRANANYPNNRAPLQQSRFVKLPLGAGRPSGWLLDQLTVQANGLTSHLDVVWNVVDESAWKGDEGKNVLPECCTARFVPRWLEGLTALSGVLHDERLSSLGKPYMEYALSVKELASVTPSVTAWCHFGRFMPEYYELTGDQRALHVIRAILDYANSVLDSKDRAVFDPKRVGMLLSFGIWYYNQTGEKDVLALLDRSTKACIEDWTHYFTTFPQDPKYFVHFPDVTAQKSPNEPLTEYTRQGIDVTQAVQYPILHSLISGDQSERDSVLQGIANLDKGYGQVGGRWAADEWLASTDPTAGTELCGVEELLFCLENGFAIMGDVRFADRIEQLIFNSFPGTTTADMWAHQYDQQANQVLVSVAKRPWHWNGDTSNIYGFTPNFPCCLSNMHSPWPRYVESMWMATADSGLVALGYGPSRFGAKVADGKPVEISEETEYPFSDRVRVTVHCKEPLRFPLHFRIPSWSNQAEVSIAGDPTPSHPQSGTLFKVEREWKDGDVVTLNFNFKVRTETRKNNAVAVAWGPLYFVLRIGEAFQKIPAPAVVPNNEIGYQNLLNNDELPAPPGCVNWHIAPVTDWNYALSIDRNSPECEIVHSKISSIPFAQKGEPVRAAGSTEYLPWHEDVPMILKVKAKLVPQWGMEGGNAAPVPDSPVSTKDPETVVELIPYGCTRLRIAEFPTV
jgi:uncharacterized protein